MSLWAGPLHVRQCCTSHLEGFASSGLIDSSHIDMYHVTSLLDLAGECKDFAVAVELFA